MGIDVDIKPIPIPEPIQEANPRRYEMAFTPGRAPLFLGLASAMVSAHAQEPISHGGMQEILKLRNTRVVTATRNFMTLDRAPATVEVITQEQIRARRYRSLLDLLRDLPDMKVDEGSDYIGYNSFTLRGLRGFSTQKLVILMDGVRITGPTNEPVPVLDNFPIHFAKQVEVVFGPASALYGADAFAGVINIITQGLEAEGGRLATGGGSGGLAFGRFSEQISFGTGSNFLVAGNAAYDQQPDLSARFPEDYAGVASWRTGVFETPFGFTQSPQTPLDPEFAAPLQSNAIYLRLMNKGFTASLFHRYAKIPSNTANNPRYAIYNKDVFLAWEMDTLRLDYQDRIGALDFQTSLVGQRLGLNPRSNYRNAFTGEEPGYKYTYSNSLRLDHQFTWSPISILTATAGFSLEESLAIPWLPELQSPVTETRPIQAKLLGSNIDADIYTVHDTQRGAFLQMEYAPTLTLTLLGGVRYDRSDRYGSTTNPRVGLVWSPTQTWTVKVLRGSAFLAPSPFDSFVYYGGFQPDGSGGFFAPFLHLPNPELRPQTLRTWEVNVHRSLGDSWGLNLSLYHTKVRNLFLQAPDNGNTNYYNNTFKGWPVGYIEVFINQGEQKMLGGTFKVDFIKEAGWGRVQAYGALSYLNGKVVDALNANRDTELPNISPWIFRLGGEATRGPWTLSPRFTWIARQRLLDVEPTDHGRRRTIDGYNRLDLSLGYRTPLRMEVFLDVQNILNARYRNVSPQSNLNAIEFVGTPQNGRRWVVGLEWRF